MSDSGRLCFTHIVTIRKAHNRGKYSNEPLCRQSSKHAGHHAWILRNKDCRQKTCLSGDNVKKRRPVRLQIGCEGGVIVQLRAGLMLFNYFQSRMVNYHATTHGCTLTISEALLKQRFVRLDRNQEICQPAGGDSTMA